MKVRFSTVPWALGAGLFALSVVLFVPLRSLADHGTEAAAEAVEVPLSSEDGLRAASIARQTMSPFCPGRTLADCPSNYATEWRRDIRGMVAKGMNSDEIQRELSTRAGDDLSGIPHRDVSYALPFAIGAAALVLLVVVFARLRSKKQIVADAGQKRSAPEKPPVETVDDERLAAELEAEGDDD